jgi:hypothetical protein
MEGEGAGRGRGKRLTSPKREKMRWRSSSVVMGLSLQTKLLWSAYVQERDLAASLQGGFGYFDVGEGEITCGVSIVL